MSGATNPTGPDLSQGVALNALRENEPLLGHVGEEAVLIVKAEGDVFALGATCSHYGGPLAEGLVTGGTVRCPWHHACFDLRTGAAIGAPALAPVSCFDVVRDGGLVKVAGRREVAPQPAGGAVPVSVAIVGAGPAGTACAEMLRREGFAGRIVLVGAELPGPVDRPNLSKDYLAGTAPEEFVPLRTEEALRDLRVELLADDPVTAIDVGGKSLRLTSGRVVDWEALVLATGAEPVRLQIDGALLPHVHTLRTLADSKVIIAQAQAGRRAVVIGASFIGLEAAASLRKRGLEVTVVGPETIPLGRVLGDEVGRFIQRVHEANGVSFRLQSRPDRITANEVRLTSGEALPANLVVAGIGVRPRTQLAEAAGLRVENGIVLDEQHRTSAPGVFAAGDVARFPYDGEQVRIEHFAVAERHGQRIARILMGRAVAHRDVPFFWSQHHDVTLSYVGHAGRFDSVEVIGDLEKRDATVVYREGGRIRAALTVGRDRDGLVIERAMELNDPAAVERAVRG